MHTRLRTIPWIAGAVTLSLAISLGATTTYADDDDPTAYLYEGACTNFANAKLVDEIDDLEVDGEKEVWKLIGLDQDMPDGLLVTDDDLDDDDDFEGVQALVDGTFAVVVHETEEMSSAVLVCGDITGTVKDDAILVQLNEVDDSGWEGRVLVHLDHDDSDNADDDRDDDDDLEFAVGIYPAGSVMPLPSPTPAG